MTSYTIDLNYQPITTPQSVLNDLCMNTALALEEGLENAYCNMFIPVSKSVTVFAEVQMNSMTRQPIYFVTSSKNQAAEIQSMTYRQAISKLQLLLA